MPSSFLRDAAATVVLRVLELLPEPDLRVLLDADPDTREAAAVFSVLEVCETLRRIDSVPSEPNERTIQIPPHPRNAEDGNIALANYLRFCNVRPTQLLQDDKEPLRALLRTIAAGAWTTWVVTTPLRSVRFAILLQWLCTLLSESAIDNACCTTVFIGRSGDDDAEQAVVRFLRNSRDASPLHEAAKAGHPECVEYWHRVGGLPLDAKSNGSTPAFLAASAGRACVLRALHTWGADVLRAQNNTGATALHRAATEGHVECIHVLLDCGADINARTTEGWTPAYGAALHGRIACVDALYQRGADFSLTTVDGWTVLHAACWRGHAACVSRLCTLTSGTGLRDAVSRGAESTAAFLAVQTGHVDCVIALRDAGADLWQRTGTGSTCLHEAAGRGDNPCLRVLLGTPGADMNLLDATGSTPLYYAALNGQTSTVKLLLDRATAAGIDLIGISQAQGAAQRRGHAKCEAVLAALITTSR